MGGLIAGAAGSCCGYICCGACNSCSESKTGAASRLPYIFLFFISSIFAILMSLYGEKEFGFEFYHTHICQTEECSGNGSVFRVSACLALFELIHVIIIIKATAFHYLWFPIKFLCFIAVLVVSFVIEGLNPFFNEWAEIARILSAFYLLVQLLIFISWAYDLNEYLRLRGDQEVEYNEQNEYSQNCCCECIPGNGYYWILGVGSVIFFIITFVSLGLFYPLYDRNNSNSHCAVHESITSVTIILVGITAALSVIRGDGSFGVASMICLYSTFLLFNAMQADPDSDDPSESCNYFHRADNSLSLWLGFFITFASLFYAAMRSDMMSLLTKNPRFVAPDDDDDDDGDDKVKNLLTKTTGINNNHEAIMMDENDDITSAEADIQNKSNYDDVDDDKKKSDDDEEEESEESKAGKSNVYFHLIMMLAAAYMSMLFTNWGTNSKSIDSVGTISFVVGVISSWTAFLLYWWTVCAPGLCPTRFPGDTEDD